MSEAAQPIGRRPLGGSSLAVTALGAGGYPLANLGQVIAEDAARGALDTAYAGGVRYFDTAPEYGYGLSERRVGDALRAHPRDSFVLSTKVGVMLRPRAGAPDPDDRFVEALPFELVYDYSYDAAMRSFEDSLQRLGLARIDLLLIHNLDALVHGAEALPGLFRTAMDGAYKALDGLRREGAVGAIGLGVNQWQVCELALEEGDFDCFLLAGRYTLLNQTGLASLLPKCAARGVSIVIGAPFNPGALFGAPAAGSSLTDDPALVPEMLIRVERVRAVCARHAVAPAAAALRFPLGHPAVAAVLAGARSSAEQARNLDMARQPIPADLWAELKAEGLLVADAPTP